MLQALTDSLHLAAIQAQQLRVCLLKECNQLLYAGPPHSISALVRLEEGGGSDL